MLLTGIDPPQPTALSWPFLNVGKNLEIFFKCVPSISVKCDNNLMYGAVQVLGFHFIYFLFCFVIIGSEQIIASGVMNFFFNSF